MRRDRSWWSRVWGALMPDPATPDPATASGGTSPKARPRLPAIVLTCDRYRPFTAHMIACYDAVWATHPFEFRVPFQVHRPVGSRIVARKTAEPIRATVLELIGDLDDEAWVYWCIDDRYPIRFVLPAVEGVAEAILLDQVPRVDGLLFCRWNNMWKPEHLLRDEPLAGPAGVRLLRRRDYSQIWLHQFLRVKVLRHLFGHFPETVPEARVLDPLKHQVPLPDDHRLYVVERNLAVFGESTSSGRVTRNCAASLRAMGIALPAGYAVIDRDIAMGVIEPDVDASATLHARE